MVTVLNYINDIKNVQGTNSKLELLKQYTQNNGTFQDVLFYTYNPFYNFYLRKFPELASTGKNINSSNMMFDLLDELRTRKITGNEAINKVAKFIADASQALSSIMKLILDRDLNMGINTKSINKIIPGLIPTFDVMLADSKVDIDVLYNTYEYLYVQKKSDGKRCIAMYVDDDVKFYARSGKEIENMYLHDDMIKDIKNIRCKYGFDFVLDGELIIVNTDGSDADRKYSNGLINRKNISINDVKQFKLIIWDFIPYLEFIADEEYKGSRQTYNKRLDLMKLLGLDGTYNNIKLIDTYESTSSADVMKITNDLINKGFEGSIVKTPFHYYERKRSKNWIKFKNILEADLRVVGYVYGTPGTKYETMLGALELESEDGLVKVNVGSGFTDEDRSTITDDIIGSIITVQYNQLIENKNGGVSLYLPRFIELRSKDVADNLDKIKKNG